MNVVHVVNTLSADRGGMSRSVPALCENLARAGATVRIVTSDTQEAYGAPIEPDPSLVTTVTVPSVTSARLRFVWSPTFGRVLTDEISASRAALVHVHGIWAPSIHTSCARSRRLQLPYVMSPRGMLSAWSLQHRRWKKRLAWLGYQRRDIERATVLHATAHDEAEELRRLGFRQPIAVIPNAIDVPSQLPPATRSRSDKKTAMFMSRIHPKKGLINLVRAWAQVRPRDWRLQLVGPDEENHRAEVEAEIAKLGIAGDVIWLPATEGAAKWELLRAADLFVLPSFSENFGIVVVEALVAGVPVITTHATPWRELVDDACGWWIPVGVDPLVGALREATSLDDARRAEMGRRGAALVALRYTWASVATQMVDVYRWILGEGPRPASVT